MKDIKCNKVFFTLCIALPNPVAMMKGHIPEVYTKMFIILCLWPLGIEGILIVIIDLTALACGGELGFCCIFGFRAIKSHKVSQPVLLSYWMN